MIFNNDIMKRRYIPLLTVLSILAFPSCIDTYDEPVETCTAAVIGSNDTNPYNALYQAILDEYVAKGIPGLSVAIETP